MATVSIFISLKPGTRRLFLRDSSGNAGPAVGFSTSVNRGDEVVWQLADNPGIDTLNAIRAKDGVFNIFRPGDPKPDSNGTWSGKVKDEAAGADAYDIDYTIGLEQLTEDPEIKVNPPSEGN